jgi:hypothetical protein
MATSVYLSNPVVTINSVENNSIEVELYQSYASAETEATIFGLVGITTNVVVAPASGTATATNQIAQPAISLHRMLTPKCHCRVWRIRGHLKVDREKISRLLSQKHAKV